MVNDAELECCNHVRWTISGKIFAKPTSSPEHLTTEKLQTMRRDRKQITSQLAPFTWRHVGHGELSLVLFSAPLQELDGHLNRSRRRRVKFTRRFFHTLSPTPLGILFSPVHYQIKCVRTGDELGQSLVFNAELETGVFRRGIGGGAWNFFRCILPVLKAPPRFRSYNFRVIVR